MKAKGGGRGRHTLPRGQLRKFFNVTVEHGEYLASFSLRYIKYIVRMLCMSVCVCGCMVLYLSAYVCICVCLCLCL